MSLTLSDVFIVNFEHISFTPFSGVSVTDLKQVNNFEQLLILCPQGIYEDISAMKRIKC